MELYTWPNCKVYPENYTIHRDISVQFAENGGESVVKFCHYQYTETEISGSRREDSYTEFYSGWGVLHQKCVMTYNNIILVIHQLLKFLWLFSPHACSIFSID